MVSNRSEMRALLTSSFVALALLWPVRPHAQDGVTLEVIFPKRTFARGEVIPMTLRFHTERPGVFAVNNASSDRSGRLSIDQFHLDHADGTTDPLADYYRTISGYIGGGLSAEIALETRVDVPVTLNEWIRFDQPGTYRVQVESGRVVYRGYRGLPPMAVTSTETELEIVDADPEVEARTLAEASATIDRVAAQLGGRVASYTELSESRDELDRALRVLRCLDTPAAAREFVRHLALGHARIRWQPVSAGGTRAGTLPPPAWHDRTFQLIAGLFGSPHRMLILSEMERRAASDAVVSPDFVRTRDLLRKVRPAF
jgi:hypothetical protein